MDMWSKNTYKKIIQKKHKKVEKLKELWRESQELFDMNLFDCPRKEWELRAKYIINKENSINETINNNYPFMNYNSVMSAVSRI